MRGLPDAMGWAFIYLAPLAVGAVTVFVAERRRRRSYRYYFWAPMTANAFFVIGTMAIMIEGLICAVIVLPLFLLLGGIGGAIMGAICRKTDWPRPAVYTFALLPLVLGIAPMQGLDDVRIGSIERSIVIGCTCREPLAPDPRRARHQARGG